MSTRAFDFGDAVFHFFRVAGEKPAAVIWIGLWQTVFYGGLVYLGWLLVGDFYIWLINMAISGQEPTDMEVLERMGGMFAFIPLVTIGAILIALMAQAAWLRLLTRGEMAAVIPFRLGGDEGRLFVTNLGLIALLIAFQIVFGLAFAIVGGGMALAVGAGGGGELGAGLAGGFGVFLVLMLGLIAAIFIGVRISAAPATTILERRIAFPAWSATKGKFWPVLGAYVVVIILVAVVGSVVGVVLNLAFLGALLPVMGEFIQMAETGHDPSVEEVRALFGELFTSPATIGTFIAIGTLSVFMQTIIEAIWHSVGAYIAINNRADAAPVDTSPAG
ncbi:hypothetical protein [Hyphobacterium sp.]|uniref:hypothetical protein n=1 Tax=Hyphobacterium sp. TaxID=2004662 RepID=UPI003BAD1FE0